VGGVGSVGGTPIWNRIMNQLLKNKPDEAWQPPVNIEKANVCGKEGYFVNGTEKNVVCPQPSPTPTPTP